MQVTIETNKGTIFKQPYTLSAFNNPYLFQPVFTLTQPINIPRDFQSDGFYEIHYPIKAKVELLGSAEQFSFDVLVVYDEG